MELISKESCHFTALWFHGFGTKRDTVGKGIGPGMRMEKLLNPRGGVNSKAKMMSSFLRQRKNKINLTQFLGLGLG